MAMEELAQTFFQDRELLTENTKPIDMDFPFTQVFLAIVVGEGGHFLPLGKFFTILRMHCGQTLRKMQRMVMDVPQRNFLSFPQEMHLPNMGRIAAVMGGRGLPEVPRVSSYPVVPPFATHERLQCFRTAPTHRAMDLTGASLCERRRCCRWWSALR